ncbi:hypothetical protein NEO13_22750 [Escherichia coli]|nr:hypothetical protein [Escherichia coli]
MVLVGIVDKPSAALTPAVKPCKHGHDSERWVYNGHCVECTMESNRRIRAEIKQIMINSTPQHSS